MTRIHIDIQPDVDVFLKATHITCITSTLRYQADLAVTVVALSTSLSFERSGISHLTIKKDTYMD